MDPSLKTSLLFRLALSLFALAALASPALAAGRAMTVDDLLAVKAVSDPQVSPDGRLVVYVVSELDREAGKTNSSLWLVPVSGGEPKRLTTTPGTNNHPRWSPDGKTIAFVSSRGGSSQVWLLPVDGGEPRRLTKLPVDVEGPIWSPKGDRIAFAAQVYPGMSPEETAKKDKEKEAGKSKARVFDRLMIRHWQAWDEGKRSHLFVCDASTGEAKDLTPKLEVNTPPAPFGGSSDYAWSPDGKELAFTAEPVKDPAWSTNTDIWLVPADGGTPKNLTEDNKAADAQPAFGPKGRHLAYLSQKRAGFEADQWVLRFLSLDDGPDNGPDAGMDSEFLDRPVQSFTWVAVDHPKGWLYDARLAAVVDDQGEQRIYEMGWNANGFDGHARHDVVVKGGVNTAVQAVKGSRRLVFLRGDAAHPNEVYTTGADGEGMTRLTRHNDPLVSELDVSKVERFLFKGADNADVSGWLVRPPGFDPKKKYPVVFLIHGGPQGAWHDEWHARWNYQMFASPGFALVAVNPRGSTGYGQEFTDQISKDWTGRVYEDLMKGLDHALKSYDFLDGDRVAAAGGSYGGFMVDWIAGHTDRFKCLISHAGVFDLESMYGTTEELWFPDWEFGGPPWQHPEHYRERSPSHYVQNFKTPTLVTHGALDFRVPDAQGIGMFTALQRRGVPSRLVLFPDEGHWVLKPANRVLWWGEMLGWLKTYLR